MMDTMKKLPSAITLQYEQQMLVAKGLFPVYPIRKCKRIPANQTPVMSLQRELIIAKVEISPGPDLTDIIMNNLATW